MEKRAEGLPLRLVIVAGILLIVMIIVIVWFAGGFGKSTSQINEKIDASNDKDMDGIVDWADPCEGPNPDPIPKNDPRCPGPGNWPA